MNISYPVTAPHTLDTDTIAHAFQTDIAAGLSPVEAEKRVTHFGLNAYGETHQKSVWQMILRQFLSPIVYLLVFGAVVSTWFEGLVEAIAIFIVILLNACIGFMMEWQARNSMNALKKMDISLARVLRNRQISEIPSARLVPGDMILLEAGDVVAADARLTEANRLQCDESSLTGESLPAEKNVTPLKADIALADQTNMVFKGTSVMNGTARAIVTATGKYTQLGMITSLVEASEESSTPLDKKLESLSSRLIRIMLMMTFVFAFTGYLQGKAWLEILKTSIALAVAAFPEGLPIVSTIALAYGMLLLARRNAIVKKLSSVETLGSTGVILTDKTGTLTENKIQVESLAFPEERTGVILQQGVMTLPPGALKRNRENFDRLRLTGLLCNNATQTTGDPVETALIEMAEAFDDPDALIRQYPRVAEIPFSSDTRLMATLHRPEDRFLAAVKGAVEQVLEKCRFIQKGSDIRPLPREESEAILRESEALAAEGLRVLAFAFRESADADTETFAEDLVYTGMVGFLDPPRQDVEPAIRTCREAGIRVAMITGDHPLTALNIARKTGITDATDQHVINGKDLPDKIEDDLWKNKILHTRVFARATPKQKLDIAEVYQQAGYVVAMTGDGVNDAPALKKADVGIAMGLRGTQVARETAGIVLKDDSFASITEAVAHGREIFRNIQKFVIYLISCNLSEIFTVTALGFIAPQSTLTALQILFLNMVTDVFPALALGVGKGDPGIMKRPPRNPALGILTSDGWLITGGYSLLMTLAVVTAVLYGIHIINVDAITANNIAFISLAFAQLFHVFNMASPGSGVFKNEITQNPYVWLALLFCGLSLPVVYAFSSVYEALHLSQLQIESWYLCLFAGLAPVILLNSFKLVRKAFQSFS